MADVEFNWKVAGYAGEGIMTTGLLFSKTVARHGLAVFDYTEYPSLIRGGHNTYQVYVSSQNAVAQRRNVDLLIALNRNGMMFHRDELTENSLVLFDQEDDNIEIESFKLPCRFLNLPMVKLAREAGGERLMANNVALGASIFLLGLDLTVLDEVIADIFGRKSSEVVNLNRKAARAGYEYAKGVEHPLRSITKRDVSSRITATGNEAIGLGLIAGGLQFYAAYPMTPSSSLLHFLAAKASQVGIVVKHAEDEISAINMAVGAAFTGVRATVGTSGGGFCYMTEGLGLAGVAEIPLVVFEGMRPGPALGLPTWTAQGDLGFIINASQDEFPRFVLAPGDGQEAFQLARQALELAEKYQTLVMFVSDKYLSESRHTISFPETQFQNQRHGITDQPQPDPNGFFARYQVSETGVSPRSLPGVPGGTYICNSYEHDQYGLATEEAALRKAQMEKRMRKFEAMKEEVPKQWWETQDGAILTFISFGSTKGVLRAAREILHREGIPTNQLHLSWLWPFPKAEVASVIGHSTDTLVVEGNYQGQLARLITQETGLFPKRHLHRYDGRPFYVEDIVQYVKELK